jgi:type IV secretion system protein VirD4
VTPSSVWFVNFISTIFFGPAEAALRYLGFEWSFVEAVRAILRGGLRFPNLLHLAFTASVASVSYVMWATVISRARYIAGVFNPFRKENRPRRWILRGLVRVREQIDTWGFGTGATAKWAGLWEVIAHEYRRNDIFLGRPMLPVAGSMLRPIGIEPNTHFMSFAGTGAGKSSGALMPNLLKFEGSLLCIDPKGELARVTALPRFERMGQEVHVVDPAGIVGEGWESACYNVFDELAAIAADDPDAVVSYADKIADALVRPISEDSYWDKAPKTFLKGLVLYVFVHEPPERRNLVRVRQFLTLGDVEAYERKVADGTIKDEEAIDAFDVLLDRMRLAEGGPYGEIISGAAQCVNKMGPNQKGGVITSADEHTKFLDFPEIRRISTTSDFLLRDLKTKPTSVYLCVPVGAATGALGSWMRMFVMMFIDAASRVDKVPDPPVLLAIDEFPSLGHIDNINAVVAVLRSYGVRFWAIAQDIEQLRATYPKSWEGFVGDAEAVQFMGIKHPGTVEYLSKLLGQHEVTKRGVTQEKPLLDPDQVARLLAPNSGRQIIWRGAHRPMLLKIGKYFEYLPPWMYEPDRHFKETRVRRFWRWAMGERA